MVTGLLLSLGLLQATAVPPVPRLVMVIDVDQMRPDYLDRFRPWFGTGGFRLLLDRGARFTEARYLHADTSTCPGHAVMLTGAYGSVNGIVANEWYDVTRGREEYCAADRSVQILGGRSGAAGRSPRNLLAPTVGDVLKAETRGRGRVITISAKDRAAIMLGGAHPDAAWWMTDSLFVTSTWYRKQLPAWVREFNASRAVSRYRDTTWTRLLPAAEYAGAGPDDVAAEESGRGMGRTFPHPIGGRSFIAAFEHSPFSNEVVAQFAMRAVTEEGLGRDNTPDLLGVSFSAIDRVGHAYGPDSHEVMDVTLRLDRTLEQFFGFLDRTVGLRHVVIVLSSDHGAVPLPEVTAARRAGSGATRVHPDSIRAPVEAALVAKYGPADSGWVLFNSGRFYYLNRPELKARGIALRDAERVARDALARVRWVHRAVTATELARQRSAGRSSRALRSFHPGRSGDVYYELKPGVYPDAEPGGTGHGSPWDYDARVPLLWFGAGLKPGTYGGAASVADIAPTLAELLRVRAPAKSEGRVLREMLETGAPSRS